MVQIKTIDITGKVINNIDVNKSILLKPHTQAIFEQVIAENAGQRQGTHSTLTKGEVRGGGKKPWQQKHTGNARQGSIRNPHWVGGGVVFGPKPTRNYKVKVNSKVTRLAFLSALSQKIQAEAVYVLEAKEMKKPSTKTINVLLKHLKLDNKKVLYVYEDCDALVKSFSNFVKNTTKKFNQVSTKDVLYAQAIIINDKAYKSFMKGVK